MDKLSSVAIGRYEARLRDVDLSIGLRVDSVRLVGESLKIGLQPVSAAVTSPGKIEIVVLESAIAEMIAKDPPLGLKHIRVRLSDDRVHLDAVKTVLVDLKVSAVCTLKIVDASKVFIQLETIDVIKGASIRQLVLNAIEKLNPIIQTDDLPFPTVLNKIEAQHGKLTLYGEVSPPK